MEALLNLSIVLMLAALAGIGLAYAFGKGQSVIAGIFGLLGSARHEPCGVQEEEPPPRWRFDRRRRE